MNAKTPLALEGVRVVDAASLFAGPVICTMLGDHGADVIKVEHPTGDNLRKLGWQKDGVSLWWALIAPQQALGHAQARPTPRAPRR